MSDWIDIDEAAVRFALPKSYLCIRAQSGDFTRRMVGSGRAQYMILCLDELERHARDYHQGQSLYAQVINSLRVRPSYNQPLFAAPLHILKQP